MSELRTTNALKLRAHKLLDEVRAGIHHEERAIRWALAILGEPVDGSNTTAETRQTAQKDTP